MEGWLVPEEPAPSPKGFGILSLEASKLRRDPRNISTPTSRILKARARGSVAFHDSGKTLSPKPETAGGGVQKVPFSAPSLFEHPTVQMLRPKP